jgi:hypothetical protein
MRHIHPVLVSLGLLSFSLAPAAAQQNVCVHAADGAIVCGPVTPENKPSTANPFDQPQPSVAQPSIPASPAAAPPPPPPSRAVRQTHRDAPPPRHAYRQPPLREFDRRPAPPRRVAHEDARQLQAEGNHRPPRRLDREPPMRFTDIERRRYDRPQERVAMRSERDMPPRQYENRLRELEREIHALRAEREQAMRHVADRRPPPRELRRDERDRYGPPPQPPRNVARDRYPNED